MPNQLVVIDPSVANYQSLIDQLGAAYSYLLLNADSDGVTQIANYVAANPGFDAIHLISHGSPGQVAVGASTLSEATIGGYTAQLNQIGASLNAGGDLLIYGCDVAQGASGRQLITELSRLTRLDVAASTNRTGSSGDWVLEAATGPIDNSLPSIKLIGDLVGSFISWTQLFEARPNYPTSLTIGMDGEAYVLGTIESLNGQNLPGGSDICLIKFAVDGSRLSTSLIGSTGSDDARAITTGADGSVYILGSVANTTINGQTISGLPGPFVSKIGADGIPVWTRLIGSDQYEVFSDFKVGLDGSIYVV